MAFKTTIRTGGRLQVNLSLSNLKNYRKGVKDFVDNGGLEDVAHELKELAMGEIYAQYVATEGHSRHKTGELKRALFDRGMMQRGITLLDNTSCEMVLIPDDLHYAFPYLGAQESGAPFNIDLQPYEAIWYNNRIHLYSIKKSLVNEMIARLSKRGKKLSSTNIVYLQVPHRVKARHFILAGKRFLKMYGNKIAADSIRLEIKRRSK